MADMPGSTPIYVCPMHAEVRQVGPGRCPHCGMDLQPEGIKFALLRHMFSSPLHIAIMAAVMLALMVTAMVFLHR